MSKTSQNLKENFMGSVPGKIAAGALAFTAAFLPMTGKLSNTFDGSALAQDRATPTTHAPSFTPAPVAIDPNVLWERKAAFRASEGRIVLHYGEGIREISATLEAESLSDSGYPAIAVPGGPKGAVELFIGRKIIPGTYTQNQLNEGRLGGDAVRLYNIIFKKELIPDMVSLAR